MEVVVWNTGRRDDRAAWDYALNTLGADIALLQETTPPDLAHELGEVASAQAHEQHSWGSAVFARGGTVTELPLPEEHHGFLVAAEVGLPGVAPLVAVSVHARLVEGYVRPNIDDAFEAIYPLIEGRRFIVGGDLNLSRSYDKEYGSTHHTEFLDDALPAHGLVNAHRKFHPEEEQTFWGPQAKIPYQDDHVYVSADLENSVTACDAVPRSSFGELSDHSPLLLSLALR